MILLQARLVFVELALVLVEGLLGLGELGVHLLLSLLQVGVLVVELICFLEGFLLELLLAVAKSD